jgi:uncharacterized protein YjdB
MDKLPFTNAGVEDLMTQLYALPQVELEVEANAAGADFPLWIKEHFELTASQIDYLDEIDEMWLQNAATETKYFLENRLPISLTKASPPSHRGERDDDRGKLITLDKNEASSYSEENGYTASETLTFSITYPTPE